MFIECKYPNGEPFICAKSAIISVVRNRGEADQRACIIWNTGEGLARDVVCETYDEVRAMVGLDPTVQRVTEMAEAYNAITPNEWQLLAGVIDVWLSDKNRESPPVRMILKILNKIERISLRA